MSFVNKSMCFVNNHVINNKILFLVLITQHIKAFLRNIDCDLCLPSDSEKRKGTEWNFPQI